MMRRNRVSEPWWSSCRVAFTEHSRRLWQYLRLPGCTLRFCHGVHFFCAGTTVCSRVPCYVLSALRWHLPTVHSSLGLQLLHFFFCTVEQRC
jgi:hypothetical protein